ncbi:hypothetical protein OAA11_02045 [Schleiferiaceae bacterium]|nr:hypothetical protein [Schleiferiaceae bacterium]
MEASKLNELYVKNGLTKDDVFTHKFFTIIKRNGIDKIQAKNNIVIEYNLDRVSDDHKSVIIKATAYYGDKVIQTYGEANPQNTTASYPVAIAEKRAMSRAVLKLTGFYEIGHYGEDEADEFNRK